MHVQCVGQVRESLNAGKLGGLRGTRLTNESMPAVCSNSMSVVLKTGYSHVLQQQAGLKSVCFCATMIIMPVPKNRATAWEGMNASSAGMQAPLHADGTKLTCPSILR